MICRTTPAVLCAALLLGLFAGEATAAGRHGGGGTSRSCLTSAARALLGRIESKFGRVSIVSTCRPGARIAGSGRISRHASGNAIDFNAPGGKKGQIVRWLIANHKRGGTMTYGGMSHIHVDIGYHFVSLGASPSGRGRARSRRAGKRTASRPFSTRHRSTVGVYRPRAQDED